MKCCVFATLLLLHAVQLSLSDANDITVSELGRQIDAVNNVNQARRRRDASDCGEDVNVGNNLNNQFYLGRRRRNAPDCKKFYEDEDEASNMNVNWRRKPCDGPECEDTSEGEDVNVANNLNNQVSLNRRRRDVPDNIAQYDEIADMSAIDTNDIEDTAVEQNVDEVNDLNNQLIINLKRRRRGTTSSEGTYDYEVVIPTNTNYSNVSKLDGKVYTVELFVKS